MNLCGFTGGMDTLGLNFEPNWFKPIVGYYISYIHVIGKKAYNNNNLSLGHRKLRKTRVEG